MADNNVQRVINYCLAHPDGSICEDWEHDLGMPHQTASPIQNMLINNGTLVYTGERRRTSTGKLAKVMVLADQPRKQLGLFA
jgi:hypothetical protein